MDTPAVAKAQLVVRRDDLTATVRALAVIIACSGRIYLRGCPVQITSSDGGGSVQVRRLTPGAVVNLAHDLADVVNSSQQPGRVTLSDRAGRLYLELPDWGLLPLNGISGAPLLSDDSSIRVADGYDHQTGLWCCGTPNLRVSDRPSRSEAESALGYIRAEFRTFPFSDAAARVRINGIDYIDTDSPPGLDESSFLVALLTAICRPSLPLAPGLLLKAPPISGAGTGKGKLVRAISQIAYGLEPSAFTTGPKDELEKRLVAVLIEADSVLFIDNVNSKDLSNDFLASILTERKVRVRPLKTSTSVRITPNAFVAITGNGLSVSEDLARRFIVVELDARMEDPEQRRFASGFAEQIKGKRERLLAAALTIWRWGRQNDCDLPQGRPLGSFEEWGRWVRDPLLALGCTDPVNRISAIKANDPERLALTHALQAWWECHGSEPITAADLAEPVKAALAPHGATQQFIVGRLSKIWGTRLGGFVVTRQKGGDWSTSTYALQRVGDGCESCEREPHEEGR